MAKFQNSNPNKLTVPEFNVTTSKDREYEDRVLRELDFAGGLVTIQRRTHSGTINKQTLNSYCGGTRLMQSTKPRYQQINNGQTSFRIVSLRFSAVIPRLRNQRVTIGIIQSRGATLQGRAFEMFVVKKQARNAGICPVSEKCQAVAPTAEIRRPSPNTAKQRLLHRLFMSSRRSPSFSVLFSIESRSELATLSSMDRWLRHLWAIADDDHRLALDVETRDSTLSAP
ncbi:hypothetical protein C8R45DRAFT_1137830 [Mycena sanguinolenta]|nr:hypothetical protein C8R45DRAFT_1137830 [Mycena sanguinolenta]